MLPCPLISIALDSWPKYSLTPVSLFLAGMFITAMAANPLAVNLATEALGQTISWGALLLFE